MIIIITIGLMVGTAFLMKKAKNKKSIGSYVLVLVGGIVTLLFAPFIHASTGTEANGAIDVGVQLASTIFGIYFMGWSIIRMVKFKKEKGTQNTPSESKSL